MIWNVSHIVWKFKFRSQNFEKIEKFFAKFSNFCFIVIAFSYAGDSDFALSVKGVSVGIEDLQVYCIYYKLKLYELFETGICNYYPAVFLCFFFIPFRFVEVCVWFCALSFQLFLLWVECRSSFLTDQQVESWLKYKFLTRKVVF